MGGLGGLISKLPLSLSRWPRPRSYGHPCRGLSRLTRRSRKTLEARSTMPGRLDPLEKRLADTLECLKVAYPDAVEGLNLAFDLGYVLAMHDANARFFPGVGTLDRSGEGGSP